MIVRVQIPPIWLLYRTFKNSNNLWATSQNQAEQELLSYSKVFSKEIPACFLENSAPKSRSMCGSPVRFGGSCHAGNFRNPNDCTCPKVRNPIVWPCPKLWLVPELRLILKRGKPRYCDMESMICMKFLIYFIASRWGIVLQWVVLKTRARYCVKK